MQATRIPILATAFLVGGAAHSLADDAAAIQAAQALALGQQHDSVIEAGERECYSIANGGKKVTIHLEPNEDGPEKTPLFNRAIRIYGPNGVKIAEKDELADDEVTFEVASPSPSMFVCVGGAGDGWIGEYRLRVDS